MLNLQIIIDIDYEKVTYPLFNDINDSVRLMQELFVGVKDG